MSRLFTCGFEENDLVALSTMWTTVGAGAASVTTTPHSGTYCAEFTGTTGKVISRNLAASVTSGEYFTRFYWRTSAAGTADSVIFRPKNSGASIPWQLLKRSSSIFRLTNSILASNTDGTYTILADTLYRIETRYLLSDTVGEIEVRVYVGDSATAVETLLRTGEDTLATNLLSYFLEESSNNVGIIYRFDDFAINVSDASGFQDSWPGPGKIYLQVPNSDVAITWEDSAGGTNNATFANIDGLPTAVNDADYNASDTTLDVLDALGDTDRFGLTDLGAEVTASATITLADVYGRVGSSQTSATHLRFQIWDESGTLTDGPTVTANVNGWRMVTTAEHLVYNAAGRTKANFDSFNVGYEPITDVLALRPRRVSELWVNVEWIESTGTTTAQMAPAFQFPGAMIGRRYV